MQPLLTPQQVREYLHTALRDSRDFWVMETRQGWVCQTEPTAEERATGQDLGLGCYMVNKRTGVITAHSSLDPMTIGEMYDEAIEAGNPVQGFQVYPPTWRVQLRTNWETEHEIEYRVTAESLIQPPLPPIDLTLRINKNNQRFQTDPPTAHEVGIQAMSWAEFNSRNGTWPQTATFEF